MTAYIIIQDAQIKQELYYNLLLAEIGMLEARASWA